MLIGNIKNKNIEEFDFNTYFNNANVIAISNNAFSECIKLKYINIRKEFTMTLFSELILNLKSHFALLNLHDID